MAAFSVPVVFVCGHPTLLLIRIYDLAEVRVSCPEAAPPLHGDRLPEIYLHGEDSPGSFVHDLVDNCLPAAPQLLHLNEVGHIESLASRRLVVIGVDRPPRLLLPHDSQYSA